MTREGAITYDDLVCFGKIGLQTAVNTYKDGMGATFSTFAHIKIRGAILDGLRKNDIYTRAFREKNKHFGDGFVSLEENSMIVDGENITIDGIDEKLKKKIITDAISKLPEMQRIILSLYFYEELTILEISKVVNLSETRVFQLKKESMIELRKTLVCLKN